MSHLLHTATLAMHACRSIDRRRAIELHMYSLTHSVNDELLGVLVYYDDIEEQYIAGSHHCHPTARTVNDVALERVLQR